MNKKGFTLIEIIAAITILGIISVVAIVGYSRYIDSTRKKAYNVMAKSVNTAAEEYVMDSPSIAVATRKIPTENGFMYVIDNIDSSQYVTFDELVSNSYLSRTIDPANKDTTCSGKVYIGKVKSELKGGLDQYIYLVDMCCSKYSGRYLYTYEIKDGKTVSHEEVDTEIEICSSDSGEPEETPEPEPGTSTYNLSYLLNNPISDSILKYPRSAEIFEDNNSVVATAIPSPPSNEYYRFIGWMVNNYQEGEAYCSSSSFTKTSDATLITSNTQICTPSSKGKTYFVNLQKTPGASVELVAVWDLIQDGRVGTGTASAPSYITNPPLGGITWKEIEYYPPLTEMWQSINLIDANIQIPVSKSIDGSLIVKAYAGSQYEDIIDYTENSEPFDDNKDDYYDYINFKKTITRSDIRKWTFRYGVECLIKEIQYTPNGSLDKNGINLVGSGASIPLYAVNTHFALYANGDRANDYSINATPLDNDNDGYVDYIKFRNTITNNAITYWKIRYCE